jgi:peptidoglycan/xylan/chitin deacetylase (PgdA/CDA1 family)
MLHGLQMEDPRQLSLKRIAKFLISLGVYAVSGLQTLLVRLTGKSAKGSCVIVYYHSVPESHRTLFAKQLDQLRRHAKPMAVNEFSGLDSGGRYVAVTFDDGFENFYEHALPELVKRGIPATMFVISDAIGKAFGSSECSEKIMSLEQLRNLPDLVTIGSHTLSHPLLPSIAVDEAAREIALSRKRLEQQLNRKILLFSFPFGAFNETLVEVCREAGYQRVFSTLPKFAFISTDEFVTGRVRVDPTDWPLEFRLKLAGAYRWLPWAFELKRRVLNSSWLQKVTRSKRQLAGSAPRRSVLPRIE